MSDIIETGQLDTEWDHGEEDVRHIRVWNSEAVIAGALCKAPEVAYRDQAGRLRFSRWRHFVGIYENLNNGIVRNFWTADSNASLASLDLEKPRPVILAHSKASDATSTDLDAFAKHGGKLIIVQGTTDMLVPRPPRRIITSASWADMAIEPQPSCGILFSPATDILSRIESSLSFVSRDFRAGRG